MINANPFMSKRNPPFSPSQRLPVPVEMIERRIFLIRGHRVMMDSDLAQIYGVSTRRLNEQMRRNRSRFPSDFAFVLTPGRVCKLEVAFCDIKFPLGWAPKAPLCLFRTWGSHGCECS